MITVATCQLRTFAPDDECITKCDSCAVAKQSPQERANRVVRQTSPS